MTKSSFENGTSTIEDFFGWINERTKIYYRRIRGEEPPWTDDEILQEYKFTNAFRELDRGTKWLHKMIDPACYDWYDKFSKQKIGTDIVFNIWWYRLFNRWEHARDLGFVPLDEASKLKSYIYQCYKDGKKIFTSAHMTTGVAGEAKHETYLRAVDDAIDNAEALYDWCMDTHSMESAFNELRKCYMLGGFVAYEIVCDLRFSPVLASAEDTLTWANAGPGAIRGLRRLGLMDGSSQKEALKQMRYLFGTADSHLSLQIRKYHGIGSEVPFELREIEHSLCEFDKYERVRLGHGTPRERFRPRPTLALDGS